MAATADDVRALAGRLPRASEGFTSGIVKFRVGRLVFATLSSDEQLMGFAFPKLERDVLIDGEPDKFLMPRLADQRYNWVVVPLERIDLDEMYELVVDAWRMCVPKKVAAAFEQSEGRPPTPQ